MTNIVAHISERLVSEDKATSEPIRTMACIEVMTATIDSASVEAGILVSITQTDWMLKNVSNGLGL